METAQCSWEGARRLPGVAGRIRDDDIAEVREKARIDDVVSGYVTLKRAGGGSLKGLCPFHDEKTPSFNVNPARQFFHCFGCGEGGDVISFLMKVDGLTFTESVERLADKFGVQLRREDGDDEPVRPRGPARGRLIEAHKVAQQFYAEQLAGPDAVVARQFLHERGFDQSAAATFGVGFAPRDGEALVRHLRGRRFSDEESVAAGLVALGRSHYDRFRGRLVWPIREANGDTIGFGARRIFDDDRIEAKYLNTSETAIYKKSQVLYGIDLARTAMKDSQQAVVVEGYTDVMACHLAGVKTAVASCGTAFGTDHARVLRRFLGDHDTTSGEVIFTFDGDSAGQKAAMKVLESDQVFASQTYVAVAPEGMDPCDLRLKEGDEAVRELVAKRQPLYRFALDNILSRHDLDRADGRIDALRDAAGLVAGIRDKTKVESFSRELAHMVGVDVDEVRQEVRRAASRPAKAPEERRTTRAGEAPDAARAGAAGPAEPVRPALPHRARDAQARHPAPRRGGPHDRPRDHGRLHPPDVPGRLGGGDRGRRARRRRRRRGVGRQGAWVGHRPGRRRGGHRARGRAGPRHHGSEPDVRRRLRLPTPGAHHVPPHRRRQGPPPAHQPRRPGARLQPDVRRAGDAGAAPPQAARGCRRPAGRSVLMMPVSWRRRSLVPSVKVPRGEKVLAMTTATDGSVLAGTRDAFYVVRDGETRRVPWEQVEAANWDRDTDTFRLSEVGSWGEERPVHTATLTDPGRLLELVRERVTASVVLQRHVTLGRRRGLRVIARRAPVRCGCGPVGLRVRRGRRPRRPGGPRRGQRGARAGPSRRRPALISPAESRLAKVSPRCTSDPL